MQGSRKILRRHDGARGFSLTPEDALAEQSKLHCSISEVNLRRPQYIEYILKVLAGRTT
jgi:hypothetical protein